MTKIVLEKQEVLVHQPVFVRIAKEAFADPQQKILVRSETPTGGGRGFWVETRNTDLGATAEFTVSTPGRYTVSYGDVSTELNVQEQRYLSFASEFGIFSMVVSIILLGMILWLRKSRRKKHAF